jgi:exopolysaccharide biosynthesis polyprenyl glycosylphosphotransferase
MAFLKVIVVLVLTTAFFGVWQNWYRDALFGGRGNYVVAFVYVAALITFGTIYDAFKVGIYRMHELSYSLSLATFFTNFFTYIVLSLIARKVLNPLAMIVLTAAQVVIIILMMYMLSHVYFSLYKARKILAIFSPLNRNDIIKKIQIIRERFELSKGITTDSGFDAIKAEIDQHEAVLICDFDPTLKAEVLKYCYSENKRIYYLPSSADAILNGSYQVQVFDTPVLFLHNGGLSMEQRIIKRTVDILLSSIGIIILGPVMLAVAIGIKATSPGPIIFKQKRITRDQKVFSIYKFRSMKVSTSDEVKKTTVGDDRVTKIGKIIRPLRIDETPQLFNILFGDMSIVGPRPEMVELVEDYSEKLPEFNLRHKVKAGLTGYAQIYGKYNTTPQNKLNMDLYYIEHYSLLEDVKLMAMTLKILFMRESTEGFSESNAKLDKDKNK